MYYLCLREIEVDVLVDFSQVENGVFVCPYSGEEWRSGEVCCPAWPRMPMGWSWSVQLATQLSARVARSAARPEGVTVASLNVGPWSPLPTAEVYYGIYIDNIFTFGCDEGVVNELQESLNGAFEREGLSLGDKEAARCGAKVVGVETGPRPRLVPPATVFGEPLWMLERGSKAVWYWMFERAMGKFCWSFPLRRRFFSILTNSFEFLAKCRRRPVGMQCRLRLPASVREEFKLIVTLSSWLNADLTRENGLFFYACDASLQGWALCRHESGGGFVSDSRELQFSPSVYVLHVTGSSRWQCLKSRKFRYSLSHILPGEITAFRQMCTLAAKQNVRRRIVIFTDNSNVYYCVRKGRSNCRSLNLLARHVLLCELLYDCEIEVRWIPTHIMPADKYTRNFK